MTAIDPRGNANSVELFIPLMKQTAEEIQNKKAEIQEARQNVDKMGETQGLSSRISSNLEKSDKINTSAAMRANQKATQVYALYKLDGEVVGMYLKDGSAFTMFDDTSLRAYAQKEADDLNLSFEKRDAYISGKIEDSLKAEFGDRFEVETFGYSDDAPLAGEYSEQFFGEDSKFKDLQAMDSKLVMDPGFFAVMTERYQ